MDGVRLPLFLPHCVDGVRLPLCMDCVRLPLCMDDVRLPLFLPASLYGWCVPPSLSAGHT